MVLRCFQRWAEAPKKRSCRSPLTKFATTAAAVHASRSSLLWVRCSMVAFHRSHGGDVDHCGVSNMIIGSSMYWFCSYRSIWMIHISNIIMFIDILGCSLYRSYIYIYPYIYISIYIYCQNVSRSHGWGGLKSCYLWFELIRSPWPVQTRCQRQKHSNPGGRVFYQFWVEFFPLNPIEEVRTHGIPMPFFNISTYQATCQTAESVRSVRDEIVPSVHLVLPKAGLQHVAVPTIGRFEF